MGASLLTPLFSPSSMVKTFDLTSSGGTTFEQVFDVSVDGYIPVSFNASFYSTTYYMYQSAFTSETQIKIGVASTTGNVSSGSLGYLSVVYLKK